MTAQSSTGNFSKFGTYFFYKLKTLRTMITMNSIFALLSYPLALGLFIPFSYYYSEEYAALYSGVSTAYYREVAAKADSLQGLCIGAMVVAIIMLICMFIMSYIIPAKSFRWLYKKTIVDMDYSLPVSDDTRFFGDLLAGLSGSLVPHGIAVGIGLILLNFADFRWAGSEGEVIYRELFTQTMITGFFSCIMFTAISLLVISVCGRSAEARIYPFVINAVIPVIHALCLVIVLENTYGYVTNDSAYDSMAATSPLGLLAQSFYYTLSNGGQDNFAMPLFRAEILIPALLIIVACITAAYFIIKYRRTERVGSPFVFKALKPVVTSLVIFAVVLPFAAVVLPLIYEPEDMTYYSFTPNPGGYIIACVVITFVLYVIMELISGKGFKRFYLTAAKYIATLTGSAVVCICLYLSNGMGMGSYVPNADQVSKIFFSIEKQVSDYWYATDDFCGIVAEEENISTIVDIHRDILDSPEVDSTRMHFSLTEYMDNGTYITRQYNISEEQYERYLRELVTPEAYYSNFTHEMEMAGDKIISVNKNDGNGEVDMNIPSDVFREAFRKDCENVSYERLFDDYGYIKRVVFNSFEDEMPAYISQSGYSFAMDIYPWYENMIALLENNQVRDVTEVKPEDYPSVMLVCGSSPLYSDNEILGAFYKTGDTTLSLWEYKRECYGYSSGLSESDVDRYALYDCNAVKVPSTDERVKTLFENGTSNLPDTTDSRGCYFLVLLPYANAREYHYDNSRMQADMVYIRPEYYELADKLFAEMNVLVDVERN